MTCCKHRALTLVSEGLTLKSEGLTVEAANIKHEAWHFMTDAVLHTQSINTWEVSG